VKLLLFVIVIITVQSDVIFTCNWHRNLPLSIVISVCAITVLYLSVNFTYFVVLRIDGVLHSEAVAMVSLISFSCTGLHTNYIEFLAGTHTHEHDDRYNGPWTW